MFLPLKISSNRQKVLYEKNQYLTISFAYSDPLNKISQFVPISQFCNLLKEAFHSKSKVVLDLRSETMVPKSEAMSAKHPNYFPTCIQLVPYCGSRFFRNGTEISQKRNKYLKLFVKQNVSTEQICK